ncbi:hypothetical protein A3F37_03245 [Candidatus Saccharibacteria bacterium RIFCSPHIGHO2_12_FULL_41_12]|nr:MAG: hypothetical protein A3F37_03245 [Candidatus Saccharibacteria bacterium RIFCSPHIGHO2_12_FULL_41_12]
MSEKSNKSTKKTTKKAVKKPAKKVTKAPAKKATTKVTKNTKAPTPAVSNEGAKSPAIFSVIKQKASALASRFGNKDNEKLVKLNSLVSSSALIYVLLGVLTALVIKPFYGTVSVYYQTKDYLAQNPQQQLLGVKDLFTVDLRWVLVGLLIISAVCYAITATKKRGMYEKSLKNKASAPRWIYLGISSVITLTFVGLLVGLNDLAVLKMSAGLIVATVVLGFISDRNNANSKKSDWLASIASLFTGVVAWVAICGATVGTYILATDNLAWYVYVVSAVVVLGFVGFAVNQYRYVSGKNKDFIYYERNFVRIDLVTKILVYVVLAIALHK